MKAEPAKEPAFERPEPLAAPEPEAPSNAKAFVTLAFFLAAIVGVFTFYAISRSEKKPPIVAVATPIPAAPTPDPFVSMTPAEHLQQAQAAAENRSFENVSRHLKAIPKEAPERKAADALARTVPTIVPFGSPQGAAAPRPAASPFGPSQPINEFVASLGGLIESYRIDSGSAYVQLSPSAWNSIPHYQRRQIADSLAAANVWRRSRLINAWFFVGNTQLGRAKQSFGSETWVFVPGDGWR